jgi:hypothetical protein
MHPCCVLCGRFVAIPQKGQDDGFMGFPGIGNVGLRRAIFLGCKIVSSTPSLLHTALHTHG